MTRSPLTNQPTFLQRMREEGSLIGQGVRKMLTLQSLWAGVKTLSWLAPLTLLIWIYAEQGQTRTQADQTIHFSVRTNDPRISANLVSPQDANIIADLSGPSGQLDELLQKIQPSGNEAGVQLTIPSSLPPDGVHDVDTASLLRSSSIFGSAIQIRGCRPPTVQVFVDKMEEQTLEVKKPESLKNIDTAIFEPATVRVRAPSEVFKTTTKLEAQLSTSAKIGKEGEQQEQSVAVKLADLRSDQFYAQITYDPPTVKATFTVKEDAEASFTYPSVVVYAMGPAAVLDKYNVQCNQDNDVLHNIKVLGPRDKIEALKRTFDTKRDELPTPRAILEITPDDRPPAGQDFRTRQLRFDHLPDPSIRIDPDDEKRAEVSFRVIDRTASQ